MKSKLCLFEENCLTDLNLGGKLIVKLVTNLTFPALVHAVINTDKIKVSAICARRLILERGN